MGRRIDDHAKRVLLAVEVGCQDLDDDRGIHVPYGLDRAGKMLGAAVGNVIAGNCRDDDVLELHAAHGLGDSLGLIVLEREGLGRVDGAESAGPGASIPGDHQGGGAAAPALPPVRALGALADGVEAQIGDHRLGGEEDGVRRQADLDPVGLALLMECGVDLWSGHGSEG